MDLVLNGETLSGTATDRLIEESIRSLTGEGDSFAILSQAPQIYIQTSGGPSYGFVLEYRDGSADEHYSCSNSKLTVDEVIRAFQSYLAEDGKWKSELEWEPQVFGYSPDASSGGAKFGLVGIAIAVLIVLVIWKLFTSA